MQENFHVALVADNNYAEFVATTIVSLFKTNRDFDHITIHLLSNGINSETVDIIHTHILQSEGSLFVYDISDISERLGVRVPNNISISSYGRLFLPAIIDLSIDKILYLDCDIIVTDTLYDLYNTNLKDNYIAGVLDTIRNDAKEGIGIQISEPYVNAGVLLISLKNWRIDNLIEKCVSFLIKNNGFVLHNDQGVINAMCLGHIYVLHPKYNVTTNYYTHSYKLLKTTLPFYPQKEIEEAKEKPVIIHYTTGVLNRPWIKNSKHPLVSEFIKIRKQTYWKDHPLYEDNRSFALKVLSFFFNNFPHFIYKFIHMIISLIKRVLNT